MKKLFIILSIITLECLGMDSAETSSPIDDSPVLKTALFESICLSNMIGKPLIKENYEPDQKPQETPQSPTQRLRDNWVLSGKLAGFEFGSNSHSENNSPSGSKNIEELIPVYDDTEKIVSIPPHTSNT